jgi:hypothetical protein
MTTIEIEAKKEVSWDAAADAMEREVAALLHPSHVLPASSNRAPHATLPPP